MVIPSIRKMFQALLKVEDFIENYAGVFLDEHTYEVGYLASFLSTFERVCKIKSKYGYHYINCVWSRNDAGEGPETCGCRLFENRKYRLN